MKPIIIREAFLSDLKAVHYIENEVFGNDKYPRFVLRQYFDCFGKFFKVAVIETKVVGYIIGGIKAESSTGFILAITVSKDYRKKGIATRLITDIIEVFKEKNYNKLILTVAPENLKAITLYHKLGFQKKSFSENYYGKDEKRNIMELSL